jgi:hypothetical protein
MEHQPTFKLRLDKSAFAEPSIFATALAEATARQESYYVTSRRRAKCAVESDHQGLE